MSVKVLQHDREYPPKSTLPILHYILTWLYQFLTFKVLSFKLVSDGVYKFVTYLACTQLACSVCVYKIFSELHTGVISYPFLFTHDRKRRAVFQDFIKSIISLFPTDIFITNTFTSFLVILALPTTLGKHSFVTKLHSFITPRITCYKGRILNSSEIKILLIIAGIEPNPGPIQADDSLNDSISSFDIISINCNGLTSDLRLLQTIGRLKKRIKSKDTIIFLQESHYANVILLENIWPGNVNVSMGSGGSRGVITLTTDKFKVKSFKSDLDGRFLFTTLQYGKNHFLHAANLYCPNNHDTSKLFLNETFREWDNYCLTQNETLTAVDCSSSIIAGDFNCVLEAHNLQNRNWSPKEILLADFVRSSMEERDLYDSALRSLNGNNFTWNRGNTFSKIDYVFISNDLLEAVSTYNTIWDLIKSDHAAINVAIKFNNQPKRGRSYPKLFLSDLKLEGACESIRNEIIKAINEFPSHWNPHQKLDFVKLVIRTNVLEVRAKNKISNDSVTALRVELDRYNLLTTLNEQQTANFNQIRSRLYREEEIENEKLRIMAGVRWTEEGERSTKFFLNSINTKRALSTIDSLNSVNGPISNINHILTHARNFYEDLYSKRTTSKIENFYQHCPTLSDTAQEVLKNPLTILDLKTALKTCKDSTPGLDGIPYSYFKIFGAQLLPLLLDSWNYSLAIGNLPQSQSTSVISLIPKSGKDKTEIKNWRPISISSCDLKIITKAISTKVGAYLNEIISESQMGYVPGRDINFNNRLLRSALDFCKENNLDNILMSLDAQKAYDSLDHEYINNTLRTYGFPEQFIAAVDLLHNNIQAQVQVNGFLSDRFSIRRGVKQGDSLSCALFIISIDPLIRNIQNNNSLPSLDLSSTCSLKTLAYADDIAIITPNNDNNIELIFNEYSSLTKMSGLTLNADKTEILNLALIGKQVSNASYNNTNFTIPHTNAITICGNKISLDEQISYESNITDKINKLKSQLNKWKNRNLSINGKMIIFKTFGISQLIFSSQFQTIKKKDLKRIEHIGYSFVWNGTDRVKRGILKSGRQEGGINGIDIESFFSSIAIRQYLKSESYPKICFINNSSVVKEDIKFQARTTLRKIILDQLNNCLIDSIESAKWVAQTRADLLVKPYSKIHQLLDSLGITTIASINPRNYKRGEYNMIRRSLHPTALLVHDQYSTNQLPNPIVTFIANGKEWEGLKLSSRSLNDLIKAVYNKTIPYHPADKYPLDRNLFQDMRNTYQHLWQIKNPTLRAIRLKVLYKDIWCQEKRFKLGLNDNSSCTICGESESAIHQLFLCSNAQKIWNIALNIIGDFQLDPIAPPDDNLITNLLQVSSNLVVEIIKSVTFKLLIQIDRSAKINEKEILRSFSYWLLINHNSINLQLRGNRCRSLQFEAIMHKLNQ